jgi:hypothetical protein
MNANVMPSVVRMEREALNKLVTEVKETLATDIQFNKMRKNSFGIVDLWHIHRNMKSANRPFNRKRNKISSYIYP